MRNEKINEKLEARAFFVATGTFLTKTFTKEEFSKIDPEDYITQSYEDWDSESLRKDIHFLAEAVYLELVKVSLVV